MSRGLKWWNLVDVSSTEVASSSEDEDKQDTEENEHKTPDDLGLTKAPRGVAEPTWAKFQELQERRAKDKRDLSKMLKRRKRSVRKRPASQPPITDGSERQVKISDNIGERAGKKGEGDERKYVCNEEATNIPAVVPNRLEPCESEDTKQRWTTVKDYFGCNSHLKGVDPGRHAPKSGLEEKIDCAIDSGDFELAELYSDTLAKRDFAVRVSKAFDCVEYVKKKSEMERQQQKKKRKLQWGFEGKHRWETKSNM